MDEQPIDPKVPSQILGVLRKGLSDDPIGQKLLARFRRSAGKNAKDLTDHVNQRLSTDKAFMERLAQDPRLPPEMRANIYGGRVDRLIQIAEAGTVNIFFGMPVWIGLSAVITAVLAVSGLVLTLIPKPLPPMGKGFNVAVAEFVMVDPSGKVSSSEISRQFSESLFNTIENETRSLPAALAIEFRGPKAIGRVADDDAAKAAAARHHTTILIYGSVQRDAQGYYQIEPRFNVTDTTFTYGGEVTGPDYLGQPITGLTLGPDEQFEFNTTLNARSQALQGIVRGLAYFSIRKYESAADEFRDAVNTPHWEPHEGQEVAYLLLGAAKLRVWDLIQNPEPLPEAAEAFNKAYELDHDYVRSYLGLGAVALAQSQILSESRTGIGGVDKDKLMESIHWYSACLNQTEPRQAYIPTKAAYGLGQAYLLGYEFHVIDGSKELAQKYYRQVIEEYQSEQVLDLAWPAAHAHAGLGRLASRESDWATMSDEYRLAIDVLKKMQSAGDPRPSDPLNLWIARFWSNAGFAELQRNDLERAQDYYSRAIEIGSETVSKEEMDKWQENLDLIKKRKS